jgi:hypothetical protein
MRKGIIIGLALLAVALVIAAIWLMPRKPRAGPWRLADGSELSLAGVTYGRKHAMRYGNGVADYLYPILTPALRKKFGCKVVEVMSLNSNAVVLWFWTKGPTYSTRFLIPDYKIAASDGSGNESDARWIPNATATWRRTNLLLGWELLNFPRRSGEIGIRLRDDEMIAKTNIVSEFKIPNRTVTNYPVWTAEPLPSIATTNNLEVSLLLLDGGWAMFNIVEDRRLTDKWAIGRVSASSAAGERYESAISLGTPGNPFGQVMTAGFVDPLWLDEPAWKVKAEVWRTANYPAEELWTLKGISIPGEGQMRNINLKRNIYGSEIELASLSGWVVHTNPPGGPGHYTPPVLHVHNPVTTSDMQLRLVEVRDEKGRKVEFYQKAWTPTMAGAGAINTDSDHDYTLDMALNVKSVDMTLAYTKGVLVEFMARSSAAKERGSIRERSNAGAETKKVR